MTEQEKQKKEAEKELAKFQKDFDKLRSKHPNIIVSGDINGYVVAYHTLSYKSNINLTY